MGIKKWVNRRIGMLTLAFSNVEKNALSQIGEGLGTDASQATRINKGLLADSLINGEVTQEVQNLRWRTYKVLKATEGVTAEIIGYDEDGLPITRVFKRDNTRALKKVKVDTFDSYPVIMVLDNSDIHTSGNDSLANEYVSVLDDEETIEQIGVDGLISTTVGTIQGMEYYTSNKGEKPIKVNRNTQANFELENYTNKLVVRRIDETQVLLEFYVSIYPDEYNRTSRLFLSALKKAIDKPYLASMLEINEVEFVSYKTVGVSDFLAFKYEIQSFDKIIEYGGSHVIKFIANVIEDGIDITEQYKDEELENKYKNKTKK